MNNLPIPVNEAFTTIQGEATHTGRPSIFIRLQGCDVGCPWCDTKYTWHPDVRHESTAKLFELQSLPLTWRKFRVSDIIDEMSVQHPTIKHVVITGGEPCTYDLGEFTTALIDHGYTVQVETSGTYLIRVHRDAWVTLSPKIGMPGGKTVMKESLVRANEIKMPVGKRADLEKLHQLFAHNAFVPNVDVWLQPLSRSEKATELCVELAQTYGYRVSIQTHYYMGLK